MYYIVFRVKYWNNNNEASWRHLKDFFFLSNWNDSITATSHYSLSSVADKHTNFTFLPYKRYDRRTARCIFFIFIFVTTIFRQINFAKILIRFTNPVCAVRSITNFFYDRLLKITYLFTDEYLHLQILLSLKLYLGPLPAYTCTRYAEIKFSFTLTVTYNIVYLYLNNIKCININCCVGRRVKAEVILPNGVWKKTSQAL